MTSSPPAVIGAMIALAGLALVYWALLGFGIISGATPAERYSSTVEKIKSPGTSEANPV